MNPSPPAEETATANSGPAMTRIGAPTMNGVFVHGYAPASFFANFNDLDAIV
jgi:hypothetical protein